MTHFTNATDGGGHMFNNRQMNDTGESTHGKSDWQARRKGEEQMTYTLLIAIMVFLALPAVAAAARIAAYQRYGAHGRLDLESGHTRDFRPAVSLVHSWCPLLRVQGLAPSKTRTPAREAGLVPVPGPAAPTAPAFRRPSPTWAYIRGDFDPDIPDHRARAA